MVTDSHLTTLNSFSQHS